MYHCKMHTDLGDVYRLPGISEELKIRTYYESLDIAGSKKVHYCCFSLPTGLPGEKIDHELKRLFKDAKVD